MKKDILQSARFVLAAHRVDQLVEDAGCEVAFAGCSNAGKSSALNALTGQKSLARTSRTPGRTQQIVVFEVAPETRLIDLPGYGYAKVPEKLRRHWQQELDTYLRVRQSLQAVVLIADIRHALKSFDRQMLAFCAASDLPCHVLLTKADKLSRNKAKQLFKAVEKQCEEANWSTSLQIFSSHNSTGVVQAREKIIALAGLDLGESMPA